MLANRLARNGWRVTIITPEATDAQSYYPFDSSVDIVRLGLPAARYGRFRGRWVAIRRILGLRRVFARLKPDVILSFLTRTNVQSLMTAVGMDVPVIVSERNNPAMQEVGPNWNRLRWLFYPRAHGLVVMNRGRSEEHTSELQSLMSNSYAVFCLKKTTQQTALHNNNSDHII